MTAESAPPAPVLVIAEAGVNHNGSIDLACALVDAAADAGADAVKFQAFHAAEIALSGTPLAEYQIRNTGTGEEQLGMLRRLELTDAQYVTLAARAAARGIQFLSTPFDRSSLGLLANTLGLSILKIPSGEITNAPFLLDIARTGRQVIVSTGMSTLGETEAALGTLAFGWSEDADRPPSRAAFAAAFESDAGQRTLRTHVVALLHCTSDYPAAPRDVNLRAMDSLSHAFGLPVGLSDHTIGIHIPVAAVARGARVIEKHFTLDRSLPGPDHAASLEPAELKVMVEAIRDVELALGDGIKRPTPAETRIRHIVRRSLVTAAPLRAGDRPRDLAAKRPGTGVSPTEYWERISRPVGRDYTSDEPLDP